MTQPYSTIPTLLACQFYSLKLTNLLGKYIVKVAIYFNMAANLTKTYCTLLYCVDVQLCSTSN